MPTRPSWCWRAADPDIVFRHWAGEQESVAYSPRSADVHLLTLSAHRLLAMLSAGQPLTETELIRRLADEAPSADLAGAFEAAVLEAIDALDRSGMIEPVLP